MAVQARVAVPTSANRAAQLSWPLAIIAISTVVRLALIAVPSHGYDSFAYKHWSWRLVHEPVSRFYVDDGQAFPDHLPGDLWLFKLLGAAGRIIDPDINFYGPVYGALISIMAMSFDVLLCIGLLIVGRAMGRKREASLAAIAYWCAPAPIFVASVWGQIDGVSTALAVIALVLAIKGRFSSAFLLLTLCALVKPQFGMLALPLLIGWWRAEPTPDLRWLSRIAVTAIGCVALIAILIAPFDMSLVGAWGNWSLLERVQLANNRYQVSVLGAHNLWIMFGPFDWPPNDMAPWIFGVSRYTLGLLMFGVIVAYSVWLLVARWRGVITMVLVSNVLLFGFFLFMTRMHERYLFPVVGLSILLAMLDCRYLRYAVAINLLVFANIALRFVWPQNNDLTGLRFLAGFGWLEHDWFVQGLALITLGIFAWIVIEGSRRGVP